MLKASQSQLPYFPQTYLLFQKDVQALPVNLHNRFSGCLMCRGVSQFLSPTDSFILLCLQVSLNVSDLLYEQLHFAMTTGMNIVSPFLFNMNSFILNVRQEITVTIFSRLPVTSSFCHDYRQACVSNSVSQ
jgi:hypothetical protein